MKFKNNYVVNIVLVSMFFMGCSTKILNENIEVATTVKTYNNFSKDEVLNAAKRVFRITDKHQFLIDSYRNKIIVSKLKANYEVINLTLYEDKIEFSVKENNNSLRAFLDIKRIIGLEKTQEKYFSNDIHEFFWNRIDYILGIKKTWPKCISRYIDFDLTLNNVLCDPVDLKNNIPTGKEKYNLTNKVFKDKKYIFKKNTNVENNVSNEEIEEMINNGKKLNLVDIEMKDKEISFVEIQPVKEPLPRINVSNEDISTIISNGKKYLNARKFINLQKIIKEDSSDEIIINPTNDNMDDMIILESEIIEE